MKIIIAVAVFITVLFIFSAARAAGIADERMEEMERRLRDGKKEV